MTNSTDEFWYRYEDYLTSSAIDSDGDIIPGTARVTIREKKLKVLKHTPKGVWLSLSHYFLPYQEHTLESINKRFVLKDARKRFACPTKKEAKESFRARKRKQIRIYESRLFHAFETLRIIDNWKDIL